MPDHAKEAAMATRRSKTHRADGDTAHAQRNDTAADAGQGDVGRNARSRRSEEATPRMPRMLTPEQAIELYKANARLALDVIDAAIEGAERVRRKQFEGEQQARALSRKHARAAATATDPQALMAAGQGATHEAVESSLRYWQEMFDLIVEIQKRLFTLMDEQAQALPGAREARAALALMPDLTGMQKVVEAMQGVLATGGSSFENMQRAMGDFARMTQGSMRSR
jgi:phasin family protein